MERQTLKEVCILSLCFDRSIILNWSFFKKKLVNEGISEDEAWRLFLQIVDALSHMSTHTILHRDIKLTNIFIGINYSVLPTIYIIADIR